MKFSNVLKLGITAAVAMALAACNNAGSTSAGKNATGNAMAAGSGSSSAQTYGVQGGKGYETASNGMVVNAMSAPSNQTYYFGFNLSSMRPQDIRAVRIQANYLANHPKAKIRLEGNTDNRGSREYNVGLGWRRDQTVARILEQQGVSKKQIQMVSYGKENPVAMGNNPKAWALNRRVNLIYKAY